MEKFEVGQVFKGEYPPEAAVWCNESGIAHIEETTKDGAEQREFTIVATPQPVTKTVRTFSKFSIWVATQNIPLTLPDGTASTVWTEFEKFLKNTKMPNGDTLRSGWENLNDLAEDNEFFEQFYPLAVETFGKELVDQVLAAATTSTKEVIVTE